MMKKLTATAALLLLSTASIAFAQNNNAKPDGTTQAGSKDCQEIYDSTMTTGQDVQCSSSAQQGTGANPGEGIVVPDATGSTGAAGSTQTDDLSKNPDGTAKQAQ